MRLIFFLFQKKKKDKGNMKLKNWMSSYGLGVIETNFDEFFKILLLTT